MTLNELKEGQSAIITSVGGEGALRQHFLDMGVIPGAHVSVVRFAPMRRRSRSIRLRRSQAARREAAREKPMRVRAMSPKEPQHPKNSSGTFLTPVSAKEVSSTQREAEILFRTMFCSHTLSSETKTRERLRSLTSLQVPISTSEISPALRWTERTA